MDTIQALIKHYIESNGYTVYSISQQSGLNRTTLQKILSGQRKITKEIYEKLLPFFALSPIDKEELEQAFLINQIGPERSRHIWKSSVFWKCPHRRSTRQTIPLMIWLYQMSIPGRTVCWFKHLSDCKRNLFCRPEKCDNRRSSIYIYICWYESPIRVYLLQTTVSSNLSAVACEALNRISENADGRRKLW